MANVTQANRPMAVTTPLGADALIIVGLSAEEALSRLFHLHLDLIALNETNVPFDQLLGQPISVRLRVGQLDRYFNGICQRVSQGESDENFTSYRMEVVPKLWLATKRARSRIFQQMSVPDILKKVLGPFDPTFKLQGSFQNRDYCVQYRETDFNFASRLMEEEGIFYFFEHSNGAHKLVLANTPTAYSKFPSHGTVTFKSIEAGETDVYITHWEKTQELRAGKYQLRDHCFEKPDSTFESDKTIMSSVQVGKVSHNLAAGPNGDLELYDYPGEYAQRFDGIDPGGGDRAGDVGKIPDDGERMVAIRMEEEAAAAIVAQGAGNCPFFSAGYQFTLATVAGGYEKLSKAEGDYAITGVHHSAHQTSTGLSSTDAAFEYHNTCTCLPAALPYRPARLTPKPVVHGTQTAVVVGPSGEEIFTDKYSRVKVQFFWDREGKKDANSSCWVRVGTPWAGKQWGMIHIPRIGQEVIVAFEEGDPDQPLIVGSVYNAEQMPPYKLPANKTQSGIVSRSTLQGDEETFNEICLEDKKGKELLYIRAEKDHTLAVEHDRVEWVGHDDWLEVDHDQTITVKNDRTEYVKEGKETVTIEKGDRLVTVQKGNDTHDVQTGNRTVTVDQGNDLHQVKMGNRDVKIDMGNDSLTISMGNQTTKLDLGASTTEALQSITLKVGQSSIVIDQMGVTIQGMMVKIDGQVQTQVQGTMTQIQGSAMLQMQGGITMIN